MSFAVLLSLRRRARVRLSGVRGFTLVELIIEMAILFTVLTAVTTLFVSGSKAELDLNARFQAQQQARIAVNRMRRDIHCASAATMRDYPANSPAGYPRRYLDLTLPPQCLGTSDVTTVSYYTSRISLSPPRYELRRSQSSPAADVRLTDYLTIYDVFTLPVPASGTLGKVRAEIPVNVRSSGAGKEWRLVSNIVLRNVARS